MFGLPKNLHSFASDCLHSLTKQKIHHQEEASTSWVSSDVMYLQHQSRQHTYSAFSKHANTSIRIQ